MNARTTLTVTAAALLALVGIAAAGPLNPPAGAVTSTAKPLSEVEARTAVNDANTPGDIGSVFKITQSGSYYLTGNISVPSAKVGVQIMASDVTLDLNGFTINGQAGSGHGVWVGGGLGRVRIRNGTITTMGGDGVNLTAAAANGGVYSVEDITAIGCGGDGIEMRNGTVRNCHLVSNTGFGVYMSQNLTSSIESTVMELNGAGGVYMLNGTVNACTAQSNNGVGFSLGYATVTASTSIDNVVGFNMDSGIISGCSAVDNSSTGIRVGGGTAVLNNTVSSISLAANTIGIRVQNIDGARIEGNAIMRQATGVSCGTANNLIVRNSFRSCTNAVSLVINNRLGPLASATAQPAITGNSGGGLGVTDPNANIIY